MDHIQGVPLVWPEGIITSEYERDTLPLLFSNEKLFSDYYQALQLKYPQLGAGLLQIRIRNDEARTQRAQGFWSECLSSLEYCLQLRRSLFTPKDFQYRCAVKHYVCTIITVGTFFLREAVELQSGDDGAPGNREARKQALENMFARAYMIFSLGETSLPMISDPAEHNYFAMILHNNFANYFARRKKYGASAQLTNKALVGFSKSHLKMEKLYFEVRQASADAFCERYEACMHRLLKVVAEFPREEGLRSPETAEEIERLKDENIHYVVPMKIQLLSSAMPVTEACYLAAYHNLSVSLVSMRKYNDAIEWCTKALEVASSNGSFLAFSGGHVAALKKLIAVCDRMSHEPTYDKYRIPKSVYVSPEIAMTRKAAVEANAPPVYHTILQQQREKKRLAREQQAQRQPPPPPPQPMEPETKSSGARPTSASTASKSRPQSASTRRHLKRNEPTLLERLTVLVPGLSQRRLVNEFPEVVGLAKKSRSPKTQKSLKVEEEDFVLKIDDDERISVPVVSVKQAPIIEVTKPVQQTSKPPTKHNVEVTKQEPVDATTKPETKPVAEATKPVDEATKPETKPVAEA
eukprot:PhF_6_TR12626/c1_g1_i2/m.19982